MSNQSGVTYYNLISEYEGDVTKNCGLTIEDMDNNFHFLRGEGIFSIEWDKNKCCFIVKKLNGEVIETDAVSKYISDSIITALSGVTEDVVKLESELSAITESLEAVYDEIDEQISGLTQYVNETSDHFTHEIQETSDYLTNHINMEIESLSQDIKRIMKYVEELSCNIGCRFETLEKRVEKLEEIVIYQ